MYIICRLLWWEFFVIVDFGRVSGLFWMWVFDSDFEIDFGDEEGDFFVLILFVGIEDFNWKVILR